MDSRKIPRASLVLFFALLAGCGSGGEPDSRSAVQGSWVAELGTSCGTGMTFNGTSFAWLIACADINQTTDLQVLEGTFDADESKLYVTLSKSTCSDAQKSFYLSYSVSAGSLLVATQSDATVFTRNPGGGGSAVATFGCFRNGVFAPSPLAAI